MSWRSESPFTVGFRAYVGGGFHCSPNPKHVGQVLHDDGRNVYQFSEGGIVKHSRGIFEKPPVVGKNYEIAYSRGQGKVIGEVSQEQAAKAEQKRSRSI